MRQLVLGVLCVFALAGGAEAATYYVNDASSPGCSDTAGQDGSASEPWCTLGYARSRISGGDTILVEDGNDGVYHETGSITFDLTESGTSGNPTVVKAAPGATPVIDGPGKTSSYFRVGAAAQTGISYVEFRGLDIRDFRDVLVVKGDHILFDDVIIRDMLSACILFSYNSSQSTLSNSRLHNCGRDSSESGEGVYIGSGVSSWPNDKTHDITISRNSIYDTANECVDVKSGARDVSIMRNTIHDCEQDSSNEAAFVMVQTCFNGNQNCGVSDRKIVIERNKIYGFSGAGSDDAGIRCDGSCKAQNNIIYGVGSGQYGMYRSSYGSDSNESYFYHNTVDPHNGTAIAFSGSAANYVTIENNIEDATSGSNIAYSDSFFRNPAGRDYQLVQGAAPHDNGINLGGAVSDDFDGNSRTGQPDQGALELQGAALPPDQPAPPTNVRIVN